MFSEVDIWPSHMISLTVPDARSLLLFAQEYPQSTTYEAVHSDEFEWMCMLEVAKPAPITHFTSGVFMNPGRTEPVD